VDIACVSGPWNSGPGATDDCTSIVWRADRPMLARRGRHASLAVSDVHRLQRVEFGHDAHGTAPNWQASAGQCLRMRPRPGACASHEAGGGAHHSR
jgi:hypothetical protein